jgi:GTP-sensing pleiotropic transcriptional regulator CodY
MDKLSELRAIQAQIMEELGCNHTMASLVIADRLGISRLTVEKYFNKGQITPIPDKSLRLLELLKDA